jgi:hypothetical protein
MENLEGRETFPNQKSFEMKSFDVIGVNGRHMMK